MNWDDYVQANRDNPANYWLTAETIKAQDLFMENAHDAAIAMAMISIARSLDHLAARERGLGKAGISSRWAVAGPMGKKGATP